MVWVLPLPVWPYAKQVALPLVEEEVDERLAGGGVDLVVGRGVVEDVVEAEAVGFDEFREVHLHLGLVDEHSARPAADCGDVHLPPPLLFAVEGPLTHCHADLRGGGVG